jgi:hypothetical protein
MRLMFATHIMALQAGTVGSAQQIHHYTQVAKRLGHEVLVYGPPDPCSPFSFSLDIKSVDALIFVFEWTTELRQRDQLDFARFVTKVPRERRIVIDCDGAYNDAISVDGDYNHRDLATSRLWTLVCDSLSDKICQPTFRPLRSNVHPFLFYGFSPPSEGSLDAATKEYGMVYVGHSKFRWGPMEPVLRAIEPIRGEVGRIALVGHGWDALPPWAVPLGMENAFYTDQAYLRKLDVEIVLPVRFEQVIPWMSKAIFNPVLLRPTFNLLRLVTPRLFETLAASTIPLFSMDPEHAREIYGECATELLLPGDHPEDRIMGIVRRAERYRKIVEGIRRRLIERHSHAQRFQELIEIVER